MKKPLLKQQTDSFNKIHYFYLIKYVVWFESGSDYVIHVWFMYMAKFSPPSPSPNLILKERRLK